MKPNQLRSAGFTLVEVLVALLAMALMAGLGWRGIDGLLRAREASQGRVDQMAVMQTALAQWRADLDAVVDTNISNGPTGLAWDGRVLRLLRRASVPDAQGGDAGLWVVAWTVRSLSPDEAARLGLSPDTPPQGWVRTQSPAAFDRATLQRYWAEALQTPSAGAPVAPMAPGATASPTSTAVLFPAVAWQLFYYRSNAWSNPLSSSGAPATTAIPTSDASVPDGVRLQLTLPSGPTPGGTLTLDWVRPTHATTRS